MKKIITMVTALALLLSMSPIASAYDANIPSNDSTNSPTSAVQQTSAVGEESQRALKNYYTGIINGGGTNYVTVYTANPIFNQQWTIGRVSGTSGKIDIEVRNGSGVVLASKAFYNDGDTPLSVFIPWDAGTCTVRVYNNNSYSGSWTVSVSTAT